ncbi:hypothetical protein EDEG_03533 [Edhazardia aedis USNM 41457]|uniref:Uncharacterized protein n=1 Tax=Edhazardia aedis (strain USNM 41457) TaxID=1003232 RepID=J8ZQN2_EDHAE|nr:hypothetical protein EDEG_03533 [Edhazardia aedis USNM 41457]|eukprot:EJW02023.1 hypothetical protein EDEG_03533 [Edhazardia aedis USNM 41457]
MRYNEINFSVRKMVVSFVGKLSLVVLYAVVFKTQDMRQSKSIEKVGRNSGSDVLVYFDWANDYKKLDDEEFRKFDDERTRQVQNVDENVYDSCSDSDNIFDDKNNVSDNNNLNTDQYNKFTPTFDNNIYQKEIHNEMKYRRDSEYRRNHKKIDKAEEERKYDLIEQENTSRHKQNIKDAVSEDGIVEQDNREDDRNNKKDEIEELAERNNPLIYNGILDDTRIEIISRMFTPNVNKNLLKNNNAIGDSDTENMSFVDSKGNIVNKNSKKDKSSIHSEKSIIDGRLCNTDGICKLVLGDKSKKKDIRYGNRSNKKGSVSRVDKNKHFRNRNVVKNKGIYRRVDSDSNNENDNSSSVSSNKKSKKVKKNTSKLVENRVKEKKNAAIDSRSVRVFGVVVLVITLLYLGIF